MNKQSEEQFGSNFRKIVSAYKKCRKVDDLVDVTPLLKVVNQERQQAYEEGRREGMVELKSELYTRLVKMGVPSLEFTRKRGLLVTVDEVAETFGQIVREQEEDTIIQKNGEEHGQE